MLICGHCGGLIKSLSDLAVHLRCEEKPQELVVIENTSTNSLEFLLKRLITEFQESEAGNSHEGIIGTSNFFDWYRRRNER